LDTSEWNFGKILPVEVPTHYAGTLEFRNGSVITIVISFDVWGHGHSSPIEIYGTEGSLKVPDPNTFNGPVALKKPGYTEWKESPLSHYYTDNMRSIGLADMACAINSGRKYRCCGELAYHILDVMETFEEASKAGKTVDVKSSCARPDALPLGLRHGFLD